MRYAQGIGTTGCHYQSSALHLLDGIADLGPDFLCASQVERLELLDASHDSMLNEFSALGKAGPGSAVMPVNRLHAVVRQWPDQACLSNLTLAYSITHMSSCYRNTFAVNFTAKVHL